MENILCVIFLSCIGLSLFWRHGVAFHPHIDGHAKRTIPTFKYMFTACVIDIKGNQYDHLHVNKFDCNNSYHYIIQMAPLMLFMGEGTDLILDGLKWVRMG